MRNVIVDCDTGVDDAIALLLALRSPALNVLGVTCVAGNVTVDRVVRNTLIVVEHSSKRVPVMQGAAQPLFGTWQTAEMVHGQDGLGDLGFPTPTQQASDEHAVDFLIRTTMASTQPVHWIAQAPLTNLALALLREPRLEQRVQSLVMMAGGIAAGNSTPVAEFNVYCDPEAADIVFRSRIPKTMVALDPIEQGGMLEVEDIEALEKDGRPWAQMAARLLRWQKSLFQAYRLERLWPPDPAAVAVAIDPSIAESVMRHVAIETQGKYTRGMTVVDRRWYRDFLSNVPPPNVNVVTHIDNLRYRRLFLDTFTTH